MAKLMEKDLVVIGGGPAGLAAALEAEKAGVEDILIIDREAELGGILQQCIHNGFGLHFFGEELTGPEYAHRFIKKLKTSTIEVKLNTMVLEVKPSKEIYALNSKEDLIEIKAGAIVFAMGCRERTRGALNIPGTRPSGIFTAGTAQRLMDIEGYMPGKKVVILGSGDIGLIMARRFVLEGGEVECVLELLPYSGGLTRNIVQCLEDFDIPLLLNHTVVKVHGKKRIQGVTIAQVGKDFNSLPGTEKHIECDTLLLSVGLIPENELSTDMGLDIDERTGGPVVNERMETSIEGVFACGNVVHVHDLADYVTLEGRIAGKASAQYLSKYEKS